jgi:hypothetical protein
MSENNIRLTIEIIDANGKVITNSSALKEVPSFTEFDQHGFAKAFDEYEKAALETTKATLSDVTEKYVGDMSKKNLILRRKKIPPKTQK